MNVLVTGEESFDILRQSSFGPRVIVNTEVDAIADGWMIEKENDLDGIGLGINEHGFTINLEGVRARLARIGNDAVRDFQTVDVRLILLIAAVGVTSNLGDQTEESHEQEKRRERSPIVKPA